MDTLACSMAVGNRGGCTVEHPQCSQDTYDSMLNPFML